LETQTLTETRRWGVEIESPQVASFETSCSGWRRPWNLTNDESVDEPECECECGDCLHECDCGFCDFTNGYGDLDHCGDCRANELVSPVMFTALFSDEERRELHRIQEKIERHDKETWGGHIHVEARDLNLFQVGMVQRAWLKCYQLLGESFTGRDYGNYCRDFEEWGDRDRLDERYCAVNVTNLVRYGMGGFNVWADDPDRRELATLNPKGAPLDQCKTTIEFRQFAGTADPNLIEYRASWCRAIVDYFANGGAWYWIARCETAEQLGELLQPAQH